MKFYFLILLVIKLFFSSNSYNGIQQKISEKSDNAKLIFIFQDAAWYAKEKINSRLKEQIISLFQSNFNSLGAKLTIDDKEFVHFYDHIQNVYYSKKTIDIKYNWASDTIKIKQYIVEYSIPHGSIFKSQIRPPKFVEKNKIYIFWEMYSDVQGKNDFSSSYPLSEDEFDYKDNYGKFPEDYKNVYTNK